ncbi:MAG: STAS domain-containing protein [Gemmataceae bacterium]
MTNESPFVVEYHGEIVIVTTSPGVERLPESTLEQAAQLVLASLKRDPPSVLIFDLSNVNFLGSMFLTFLLRCHKRAKEQNSNVEVCIAGASAKAKELLHITALDTLWPLYDSRKEAIAALSVD